MKKICSCGETVAIVVAGLLFHCTSAFGAPFDFDVELSKDVVIPGEPLYLNLVATRDGERGSEDAVLRLRMSSRAMTVQILDRNGEEVGARPKEEWYPFVGGSNWSVDFLPGEELKSTILVHRWSSTFLPAGEYAVLFRLNGFSYRDKEKGVDYRVNGDMVVDGSWRFPLIVLPRNDDAVRGVFAELAAKSVRANTSNEAVRSSLFASDSIVYAQGPLALPYQMEILRKAMADRESIDLRGTRLLDMWRYIAHSGDAATARKLVEFGEDDLFEKDRKEVTNNAIWRYLVWAIHELHRLGDDEIHAVTSTFVATYPSVWQPKLSDFDHASGPVEDY